MQTLDRKLDIQPLSRADMTIHLNGQPVEVAAGETVLTVLNAVGLRQVARNDHAQLSGAFAAWACVIAVWFQSMAVPSAVPTRPWSSPVCR